jgi:hypothetical protein
MADLLAANIDTIVKTFNDELNTLLNQLMIIADQIEISKTDLCKVKASKKQLLDAIYINVNLCVNMYAFFLLKPEFETFLENVQKRNYEYFYLLADNDIIEPEFRELLSIIKTVSYGIDDETKNIIFGYIENITVLADIYAYKKMEK